MRWMSYWELACVQRTITVYPVGQKQGFEEIGAQVTLNSPGFPPSRLLNNVTCRWLKTTDAIQCPLSDNFRFARYPGEIRGV